MRLCHVRAQIITIEVLEKNKTKEAGCYFDDGRCLIPFIYMFCVEVFLVDQLANLLFSAT